MTQPPGVATPLHRHTREAEAFYLLDGQMDYRAGEQDYQLHPGCFIYLPVGLPHAFRIRGDQPARFLAIAEPGGLLHLYDEVGIPAAELRLPAPTANPWRQRSPVGGGLPAVRTGGRGPTDPRVNAGLLKCVSALRPPAAMVRA